MRNIALSDGDGMAGELMVFKTDVPEDELKKIEKISCQIYTKTDDTSEVPIWSEVFGKKGFTFQYVDSCTHVTAFCTSSDWLKEKFPEVKEIYKIEKYKEHGAS